MKLFEAMRDRSHEQVLFTSDPESGLRSIIAIHSTALGPALGGTRFYPYPSEEDALRDVLRLSEAMTLKNAAAGLDLGGGKAVIIGDPHADKSERLLRAHGRAVHALGGRYITAEDVGTTLDDLALIKRETPWATGVSESDGGSGDPSPATARGLFAAVRAVSRVLWDSDELDGRRVAIQGVGKVGFDYARQLTEAGCAVVVADLYGPAAERARAQLGVDVVPAEGIYDVDCDIFAPCAMGASLNPDTIPRLNCAAIVGSANNQLASDDDATDLARRDILYVPDFIANAGGVINLDDELQGYSRERAKERVDRIYDTVLATLTRARGEGTTPLDAAVMLARERIESVGGMRRASARFGFDI